MHKMPYAGKADKRVGYEKFHCAQLRIEQTTKFGLKNCLIYLGDCLTAPHHHYPSQLLGQYWLLGHKGSGCSAVFRENDPVNNHCI